MPRGRYLGLTPDVQKTVVESVGQGAVYELAAMRVGLSVSCIYKWLAKGRKSKNPKDVYFQFFHALKKAEGDRALLALARIGKAGQGGAVIERTTTTRDGVTTVKEKVAQPQWTADAWLLERLHDEHYSLNKTELRAMQRELADLKQTLHNAGVPVGKPNKVSKTARKSAKGG